VFTHGGRNRTGKDAIAFAREAADRGAGELLVTSMDRDGVKTGYDLALLQRITDVVRVPVIASGGAGTLQHLVDAITIGRASAALAASIFHFGTFTIAEARAALAAAGVPVRTV
jgi:cyclase